LKGEKSKSGKRAAQARPAAARGKRTGLDPTESAERLRFETLLTELSARFIKLPADRVDAEIEDAQRRVCECTGLDAAVLLQRDGDAPGLFSLTHHYRRVEGPPITRQLQAVEAFPWSLHEVQAGRSALFSSLAEVPEGAERDRESFLCLGVLNALVLPLSVGGGAPFGAITFHDMVAPRAWSDALVQRLELVAQIFANTLARKRYEQRFWEGEEQFQLAMEAAGAAPWVFNAEKSLFWVGNQGLEIFGLPLGNSLEFSQFMGRVHPEDRPKIRRTIEIALQSQELMVVEYRIVRPDGQVRWLLSRGRASAQEAGGKPRLMGVTTDITARKEGEKALRESGTRMAAALDVAELGFYELINDVRVDFLDRRAREILGASEADEQAGRILEFWWAHVHAEDRPWVMEVQRLMEEAGRDRMTVDYRFLHPARGVIHIHHLVHVIERDAAGLAVRTIGVLQDVTERKQKEEDLRAKQGHLASAIEAAGLGFYEMGEHGRTHVTDDHLRGLIGISGEIDETRVRDFWLAHIHPEDLPRVRQASGDLLEGKVDRVAAEYRYRHPTRGEIWFHQLSRVLARDASGRAVRTVGVIQDITERKAAELEARRVQNELAHATRMSVLGELAASMAHELNQPLAAILSNAQAARRFLAAPEPDLKEIREILDDIVRDDKRAGDVIHHMRAMVQKKGAVAAEPLDFNGLVRDTTKLVHSEMVGRNVGLELVLASGLPAVLAGRVEMQQVLLNLMVNAMDAMRDQPAERRQLRIQTSAAEGWVRVALRDYGHGIPEPAMADIFRPFFTTKTHGLGMGLSISRSMVEAHGGKLWAENAPDGGAVFWIEMPAQPAGSSI